MTPRTRTGKGHPLRRVRPRPQRRSVVDHRRRWRQQRQPMPIVEGRLADVGLAPGLPIHVCHFPPGTSKWNKIEHRMFSHIAQNWRGRPLISHEVIVNLIANTTTQAGLRVRAELNRGRYPTGIRISDAGLAALNLKARQPPWRLELHRHACILSAQRHARPPLSAT